MSGRAPAPAGFEHFETEADVGVRAWGPTRAVAFGQAALGVFALIVDPAEVEEREQREVRAQGDSPERLLAGWINECLYVHEIEGFVVSRVEVDTCVPTLVHGVLHGEAMDSSRHRPGTIVKAATLHRLVVTDQDGQHEVRVIVDV
jgi:tRNA nucleotidyltransferase (CCA-adding enzyme)